MSVPESWRPLCPAAEPEVLAQCDKDRVVIQPTLVFTAEFQVGRVPGPGPVPETLIGRVEEPCFVLDNFAEIDVCAGQSGYVLVFFFGQEAPAIQQLGAYKERICRKRRQDVVRAVRLFSRRRIHRQDLPVPLPGAGEKIGEPVCLGPEVTNTVPAGQRSYMKQYTACSFVIHLFTNTPENPLTILTVPFIWRYYIVSQFY